MKSEKEIVEYALGVVGWLGPGEGMALLRLAKGKDVIEVGSMYGKSTAFMAPVAKSILCVDTFTLDRSLMGPRYPHKCQARVAEDDEVMPGGVTTLRGFLKHMEPFNNITTVIGDSQVVGKRVANGWADFIFIDANHTYESVSADIKSWLPKLVPGGIIAFHDYGKGHKGVTKAVDKVFKLIGCVGTVAWTDAAHVKRKASK
jgi:SAM-dependent methyltransferase